MHAQRIGTCESLESTDLPSLTWQGRHVSRTDLGWSGSRRIDIGAIVRLPLMPQGMGGIQQANLVLGDLHNLIGNHVAAMQCLQTSNEPQS